MRRYILRLLGITDLGSNQDQQHELYARLASVEAKANYLNREHCTTLRRLAAIDGSMTERKQQPAGQTRQIALSIGGKQTSPEPVDDAQGVLLSYGGPRVLQKTKKVNRRSMVDFYDRALGGYDVMKHVVLQEHWYTISSDGNGKWCLLIRNRTGFGNWITRKPRFDSEDAARRAFTEILGIHHMQTMDPYSIWLQSQHRQMRAQ